MADQQAPILCPTPDYDTIRRTDTKEGQEALAVALRNIVNTLNAYISRHPG